jgi:hypothetical protein
MVVSRGRLIAKFDQVKTMPAVLFAMVCAAALVVATIADWALNNERSVYKLWTMLVVVFICVLIKRRTIEGSLKKSRSRQIVLTR